MTAVPSPDGQTLSLVCDGCGRTVADIESSIDQWRVVWAVVSRTGWGGSRHAIGPHNCPQCDRSAAESGQSAAQQAVS